MASADASPPLFESLLHGDPTSVEPRPQSRWAYPLWGILFLTVFVAYHSMSMLVWNLPNKGLVKDFNKQYVDVSRSRHYFNAAQLHQSWAMFAPNPTRANVFIRVFVEDQQGELWDFEQDIWEEDRYPYWFYDRRGKVNRRLDGKKNYQTIYGAWVCREWERQHDGEPARAVTFVKRWTKIPSPQEVLKKGGWDQWEAPYKQNEQETITCKTTTNAQLPPYLRERYGLPPLEDDKAFRPVRQQTWWDRAEAERKKQEREAETAARREKLQAERDARRGGGAAPESPEAVQKPAAGPEREGDGAQGEEEVDY